jgi:hypothetical protein
VAVFIDVGRVTKFVGEASRPADAAARARHAFDEVIGRVWRFKAIEGDLALVEPRNRLRERDEGRALLFKRFFDRFGEAAAPGENPAIEGSVIERLTPLRTPNRCLRHRRELEVPRK